MERFAFKIDKELKANLYKICRLCGIDNPDKVPIFVDEEVDTNIVDVDTEPELRQKILELIGLNVRQDDKMPQMVCSLCVDKINDFFEFREMCYSTNIQTRKLLGIKEPKKDTSIKVEIKSETSPVDKRGRKRKSDEIENNKSIKEEIDKFLNSNSIVSKKKMRLANLRTQIDAEKVKSEPLIELVNFNKLRQICKICKKRYSTKKQLERHTRMEHLPNIPRYVCTTCNETIKKNNEMKNHQLWHKLSKTPYTCGLCGDTMLTVNLFTRHLRDHCQKLSCKIKVFDRECMWCHNTFSTNFLYNSHACAVRTKKCGGCNKQTKTDLEYLKHIASCEKAYLTATKYICGGIEDVRIKNENEVEATAHTFAHNSHIPLNKSPMVNLTRQTIHNINLSVARTKKKGLPIKDTLVNIKHEPEMHVDSDVQNNIPTTQTSATDDESLVENNFYDEFQNENDSDTSNDGMIASLIPIVQLETSSEILVKQEPRDERMPMDVSITDNLLSIKKEIPDSGYEDSCTTTSAAACKLPMLKLKITREHGTLNSSLVNQSPEMRDKKKKKKKRKDTEKSTEECDNLQLTSISTVPNVEMAPSIVTSPVNTNNETMDDQNVVQIKQERLDNDYSTINSSNKNYSAFNFSQKLSATTIMTQIHISGVTPDIDCGKNVYTKGIQHEISEDIKPNREELDHWLQSNSITQIQTNPDTMTTANVKEQSGRKRTIASQNEGMPKIVAVSGGIDVATTHNDNSSPMPITVHNVHIKAEPNDDEYYEKTVDEEHPFMDFGNEATNFTSTVATDEQNYINRIDFNNIKIKEEKDIEVNETQLVVTNLTANIKTENIENDEVQVNAEDEEDESELENISTECIEKREYREIEFPPQLKDSKLLQSRPIEFVISNVCTQEDKSDTENNITSPTEEQIENVHKCDEKSQLTCSCAVKPSNTSQFTNTVSQTETIQIEINESPEKLLNAQPCSSSNSCIGQSDEFSITPITTAVEEQQNILNHDLVAHNDVASAPDFDAVSSGNSDLIDTENVELEHSTIQTQIASKTAMIQDNNEETDNLFNENVVAASQSSEQQHQQQQRVLTINDDNNVNEIAENNNNANIERELLDDREDSNLNIEQNESASLTSLVLMQTENIVDT